MVPVRSASTSASWSTTGPRAVLISIADGFIALRASGPIKPCVCGVSGTCRDTKSDSPQERGQVDLLRGRLLDGATVREDDPHPKADRAPTDGAAIFPIPTMPSVAPVRSVPSQPSGDHVATGPRPRPAARRGAAEPRRGGA